MEFSALLGFAAVALTLTLTPGADWAYTIAAGLRPGSPVPSVAGLCSGYVLHTALVAAGLGVVLAGRPDVVSWLSLAGALYLLWLGGTTARGWRGAGFAGSRADAALPSGASLSGAVGRRGGAVRDYLRGVATSGINPKALLLFVAVMPQFIVQGSEVPVAAQTAAMGATHILLTVVVYSLVAVAARRILRARPRAARVVTLASGVIMIGIGAVLLAEQAAGFLGGLTAYEGDPSAQGI